MTLIVERNKIELNALQSKMIVSGWNEQTLNNSVVEKITYLSDGLKVKGYIAYPSNITGKKLPCVLWNRGGFKESGAIDRFTAKGIFGYIASCGFVVLSSQYRGNDGGEGMDEMGGAEVNDIKNLLLAANELEFADTSDCAMIGWSRGGMMTLLSIIRELVTVKTAILVGAISDFKTYITTTGKFENVLQEKIADPERETDLRTVIDKTDLLKPIPYLIIHGGNDEVVPVEQSLSFAAALSKHKLTYRLIIYEDGDHVLKAFKNEVEIITIDWLKKYLAV